MAKNLICSFCGGKIPSVGNYKMKLKEGKVACDYCYYKRCPSCESIIRDGQPSYAIPGILGKHCWSCFKRITGS